MFVLMVDRRRQWRAENQPINIDREISDNEFIIKGSEGDEYYVNINVPICDCPDWEKREPKGGCKHIIKAKLKKDQLSALPDAKTNNGKYTNKTEYSGDWQKLSNQTKKRDNWTCQKCRSSGGKFGDAELHTHHIVPKSKGGADELSNLITLCKKCHENQHGHSIGFDEPQSNNTSISNSNVNSESGSIDAANKADDNEEQYYDVEPGLHPDSGQSWAIKDSLPPGQNIEKPHGDLERDLLENSKSQNNSKLQDSNFKPTDGNQAEADINAEKPQDKNEDSALDGVEDSQVVQSSTDTSKTTHSSSTSNSTPSNTPQENNSNPAAFTQFLRGVPVIIFVISFITGIAGTSWGIYKLLIQYVGNHSQMWLYSALGGLVVFSNIWFNAWDYIADFLDGNNLSVTMATIHTLKIFLIFTVALLTPYFVLGYVTDNVLWGSIGGICGLIYCMIFFGRQYTNYE